MINYNHFVVLNKPENISSTSAMSKVRKLLQAKKAGHAGTLDPLACGVLIIALGNATRLISYIMNQDKEYKFSIRFGQKTSTDDREGEVIASNDYFPSVIELENILPEFIGNISQIPPIFSAIHIQGKRAYDLARNGKEVCLEARSVTINSLKIEEYKPEHKTIFFRVSCSKGTYVRSLARDIAEKLGGFGHVGYLERTMIGNFSINDAISLDKLIEIVHNDRSSSLSLDNYLLPSCDVLGDIPVIHISNEEKLKVRNGQPILITNSTQGNEYKLLNNNDFIAIAEIDGGNLKPKIVFNY